MRIIGCDLHARQQTLAMLDTTTGEVVTMTLKHEGNNVREFYSKLPRPVRVGIEATGSMQWFVSLMEELGIECQVGHPAQIRAAEPRKQKHDRRDADLILKLLAENRFPRIWLPSKELQDLRALLRHRHQWVRIRTRIQNALQAIALANGLRRGPSLWSQDGQSKIAALPLAPHTAYRRSELQAMYAKFAAEIEKLNQRVEEQACERPGARLLMTHPGVGPITALATEVFLGDAARFADSKALASYVGMIPSEYSSGGRQRLGGVSKQGNPLLRFLWGEAAAHAVRRDPELQRFYRRKLVQKGLGKSRVAVARKLGIRLWIMLRDEIDYNEFCRRGQKQQKSSEACVGMPDTGHGAYSQGGDRVFYWIAAEAGLRAGELTALRASDVDVDNLSIEVSKAIWNGTEDSPKTDAAFRCVCISPQLGAQLKEYLAGRTDGYLFQTSSGNSWDASNVLERKLNTLLERLEIPKIDIKLLAKFVGKDRTIEQATRSEKRAASLGLHSFRHTVATAMDSLGIPQQIRRQRLGHSGNSVTDIYTHTFTDDERNAAEKLGELFGTGWPEIDAGKVISFPNLSQKEEGLAGGVQQALVNQ